MPTKNEGKAKVTLKKRQEKKYPFPDSASRLEELLKTKLIQLPEIKRLEEANKINEINYYKYHRLVSHPIEKCFILKDKIMALYEEGKI